MYGAVVVGLAGAVHTPVPVAVVHSSTGMALREGQPVQHYIQVMVPLRIYMYMCMCA